MTGELALLGAAVAGGGAWSLFHPRATVFGPVVWRGPGTRPEVALTFDDGPHPTYTPRVAEALERAGARATFFCVGARLEAHAALASALVRAGHALENHTHVHGTGRDLFDVGRLTADLRRCQDAIAALTGRAPRHYRPAVGIRNPVVHRAARALGLTVVTWTDAARDGAFALDDGRARRMAARARPGSILALHDGGGAGTSRLREATVAALPALLDGLRARGLACVTLEALLRAS